MEILPFSRKITQKMHPIGPDLGKTEEIGINPAVKKQIDQAADPRAAR